MPNGPPAFASGAAVEQATKKAQRKRKRRTVIPESKSSASPAHDYSRATLRKRLQAPKDQRKMIALQQRQGAPEGACRFGAAVDPALHVNGVRFEPVRPALLSPSRPRAPGRRRRRSTCFPSRPVPTE